LAEGEPALATSRIALVEVTRATSIANPSPEALAEAERLLASCLLVDVSDGLLRAASRLTSRQVRSLDAVHLASAQRVDPDAMLVYDRRLRDAARSAGFLVAHPGVPE
jgi:uncharacterized protein